MSIIKRPYSILSDFTAVYEFLGECYTTPQINSMMIPQFYEYTHAHCMFNKNATYKMTVWEDGGKIRAYCGYEMDVGEAYLVTARGYEYLLDEMIAAAEAELYITDKNDGSRTLGIWVTESQTGHIKVLTESGYKKVYTEAVTVYRYERGFKTLSLPDGFKCVDITGVKTESDYMKLNRCTYRGFDHGDDIEYDIDSLRYMGCAPHYRPDLSRIIVAPDGEFAVYAGIWLDEKNKYAYLDPLCTQPEYRRMGLASYALTDAMKMTRDYGAEYCFGGINEFYYALGFEDITHRVLYEKKL